MRDAMRDARRTMASVPGAAVTPTRMLEELLFSLVGQKAQGKLSERHQVVFPKEVSQGLRDLLRWVDIPVQHPAAELLGG
jgi:hypothetical protein